MRFPTKTVLSIASLVGWWGRQAKSDNPIRKSIVVPLDKYLLFFREKESHMVPNPEKSTLT